MKLNLVIVVILLLTGVGLAGSLYHDRPAASASIAAATTADPATAQKVPDFTLALRDGSTRRMADLAGKIVVLNFWASWCAPCLTEFPDLLHAAAAMPDDVILVALSSDREDAPVARFLDRLPAAERALLARDNILIARDPGGRITLDLFNTISLPETLVIDRRQIIRHKIVGPVESVDSLSSLVKPLL